MALTTAQRTTLKADVLARLSLAGAVALADWPAVANFYNTTAVPAVSLWMPNVGVAFLNSAIAWATYKTLTLQEQGAYRAMTQIGSVDMTDNQVRQGFSSIFGSASASWIAIRDGAQRPATYFEALFSVASGSAFNSVFYGQPLSSIEVQLAMV